ncbi:hypothetical protein [Pseudonocardia asaccharolytica]|uniref:Uncharacterized protein n=1 Tax=Pseudonocardia asaccharolytica DSM 44247 = NBRC 16224 TaxID=1123024 RepID=A0A511D063_9PSEU|nr:hypothetical protein [Pseudonocardia asaccharolytica]GEL18181.1 hypothetical protein PA7_20180 [Pseudonocardia asaccharolytica DSM 44247 = NBRC 16224]
MATTAAHTVRYRHHRRRGRERQPRPAYSNAVGGIAAQTGAIAVADLFHRRGILEHAAASLSNILFGWLLMALLVLVGYLPEATVAAIRP